MGRPCEREHPDPGATAGACRLCWLAVHDPRYAALFAGRPPPATPAAPCAHLGRDLSGPERAAAGLDHARRWALCLHPSAPLGPAVCPCRGCGPRCPGYEAGEADGG